MSENINVNFRMDKKTKEAVESIFSELGLNMTTAINIFARQVLLVGGLPFSVTIEKPNTRTLQAFSEGDALLADSDARAYSSFSDFMKEASDNV